MSIEDKKRWNEKYTKGSLPQNRLKVLEEYAHESKGKKALDIACGLGRNSKYLAEKGFEVHAIDISDIAIKSLEGITNIKAQTVDLDSYTLKKNNYDLIVCTYFLERRLFPQIKQALKEEGVFIMETFMHDEANTKVPSNKAFLLNKGELESIFKEGYRILYHREFMDSNICGDKSMKVSWVVQVNKKEKR